MRFLALERACPHCGNHDVERRRRRGFFEFTISKLLKLRPYYCDNCGKKFFRFCPQDSVGASVARKKTSS